jgi:hypothetical protein
MRYHYVYYSYEDWGRGYIGRRSCSYPPEQDTRYLGSFRDKTFRPTNKIILETYETMEQAIEAEIILHKFYDVARNPHFANKARQTSVGFNYITPKGKGPWRGLTRTPEDRKKFGLPGKLNPFYGKTHSDETMAIIKEKLQVSMKGENNPMWGRRGELSPSYGRTGDMHPQYGKHWWTDGVNNICSVECPDGFRRGRTSKKTVH